MNDLIKKFNWTFYGFVRLNLFVLVIVALDFISGERDIEKLIGGFIFLLQAANLFVFVALPFVDLFFMFKDKKMCSHFGISYTSDFLSSFTEKEKEQIRANFQSSEIGDAKSLEDLLNKENKVT
ncbi:hypothetical protein RI845_00380 [Thalassotalea nanhaiensis]|uniref:Uncharacterized protein n=1 Tax=Thalassotalea nanhaiensis TaxID=3065648 RepID=A0ABY9TJ52_9GAMM|nr:hypothetical protein RI845_00380 [Colwelliaceae bacterium SQ345]